MQSSKKLVIGYWNLRGTAQIIRLLLEYLNIPYVDQILTPKTWCEKKRSDCKNWAFIDLPYLIDSDIVLTETYPIITYILKKYGHSELLGKNQRDESLVDMNAWFIDNLKPKFLCLAVMKKCQKECQKEKKNLWQDEIQQKLCALNEHAHQQQWFLGYLTLIDFSVYEIVHYIQLLYPGQINKFPKLIQIQRRVGKLSSIQAYEKSSKAIKLYLPNEIMCQKMISKFQDLKKKSQ